MRPISRERQSQARGGIMLKVYPESSIPVTSATGSKFLPILAKTQLSACKHSRKCLKNYSHVDSFTGSHLRKPAETCRGLRKWSFFGENLPHPSWAICIQNGLNRAEMDGSVAEVTPPHPLAVTSATALMARSGGVTTKSRAAR